MDSSSRDSGSSARPGGAPRDRRATHRAAIEIPASIHLGSRRIGCSIRNLSAQGIALTSRESVAPGMVVRVVFRLPNARQPLDVAGVLVRSVGGRDGATVGLQFIEPDADAVRAIETFVARNRSDRPFSGGGGAAAPAKDGGGRERRADPLAGLYKRAVSEVAEKSGKRRGLFARWRRRGK